MKKPQKGTNLIEVLLFVVLLSVIVLALSNIDIFSRSHVISSDRRAKVQNEVSFVMDHMTKKIGEAIGDVIPTATFGADGNPPIGVQPTTPGDWISMSIRHDSNGNNRADDSDEWYGYKLETVPTYQMLYYNIYSYPTPPATTPEVLSGKIVFFMPSIEWPNTSGQYENFVVIELVGCWDPKNIAKDGDGRPNPLQGTSDNPCVTMKSKITMPQVTTH